jgi:phosphatidylserine/phosphatidylglycerophosphate/cardiolipin synthase-like enzyme
VEAAQRGVQVKLLLNDDRVFHRNPGWTDSTSGDTYAPILKNEITRLFVEKLHVCENLPIMAEVIDVEKAGISYIHNKGFIIDGKKVLVSSRSMELRPRHE